MKRIGILTSGGDAPAMNAAIRSVVRVAAASGIEVLGYFGGYKGLIENNFTILKTRDVGNVICKGGTFLKTSRCDEFKTEEGQKKALNNLKKEKVDGLVCIGGDGTFRGAMDLEKAGVNVAFIPASIDNDLPYTDRSLGFDTACNTVVDMVNNLRDTSESHDRIFVVEVMGAFCGDIAIHAGIASGAEIIFVPEIKKPFDEICKQIEESEKSGKLSSIIFVNEKVSSAEKLAHAIKEKLNREVRPVVLGHVQRGGSPSYMDRLLATEYGETAVETLIEGKSGAIGCNGFDIVVIPLERAKIAKREFNQKLYKLSEIVSR